MAEKKTTNGDEKLLTPERIKILKDNLLKDYNEQDVEMFLAVAELTKLDPFTRQLMARPEKKVRDKQGRYEKMILLTAYTGFLTVADRSGLYDGSDPWEWCGSDGIWVQVWTSNEPPFAARVATWRKDHTRPEVAVAYWQARAQYYWNGKENVLTDTWFNDGPFMLAKCAFAASLRRLFPSLLTQVYEESEFKALEAATLDAERVKSATEKPKAEKKEIVTPASPVAPTVAAPEKENEVVDDLDMGDGDEPKAQQQRAEDWWRLLSCDPIKNRYYTGKVIEDLSLNLLVQAVEKWVPKVREKKTWEGTTQEYRDLAEGLEIALAKAQEAQARAEASSAGKAAEGRQ
jgi:RecT family